MRSLNKHVNQSNGAYCFSRNSLTLIIINNVYLDDWICSLKWNRAFLGIIGDRLPPPNSKIKIQEPKS